MSSKGFPYLAVANLKYKSPHKQDLTFSKGEKIRVVALAPKTEDTDEDDDEDDEWFIGESLDGSRKGTFPGGFVTVSEDQEPLGQENQNSKVAEDAAVADSLTSKVLSDSEAKQKLEESEKDESKIKNDGAAAAPTTSAASDAQSFQETTSPLSSTGEKTGFGAPLPARPQSDEEEEEADEEQKGEQEQAKEASPVLVEEKKSIQNQAPSSIKTSAEASNPSAPPSRSTTLSPPPQTASKPPPPSKPNSLKDRIAAFNKPAESGGGPPPLPKSKPGGWKRPAPAPGAPKPLLPGAKPVTSPPAAPAPISAGQPAISSSETVNPSDAESPQEGASSSGSGFSAADAKSSIKMSLKERMAALQRGDPTPASDQDSNEPKSPAPPPAAPGKISQEKRNVALGGLGLGPEAASSNLSNTVSEGNLDDGSKSVPTVESSEMPETTPSASSNAQKESSSQAEESSENPEEKEMKSQAGGEDQEQTGFTEEEQESARRAAIAERLAKLGGRRMGGGPLFGGPPPPVQPKPKNSMEAVAASDSPTSMDPPASQTAAPGDRSQSLSDEVGSEEASKPQTLAVPRRAAPPRRKKSSATPAPIGSQSEEQSSALEKSAIEQAPEQAEPSPVESTPDDATSTQEESIHDVGAESLPTAEEGATDGEETGVRETAFDSTPSAEHADPEAEVKTGDDVAQSSALHQEPEEASALSREEFKEHQVQEYEQAQETEEAAVSLPPQPTSVPPRPPSTGSYQTPSRPGSVRPPIPKSTPIPPPTESQNEEEEQDISEAASAPPIASPPPRRQLPTPTPPSNRPPIPKSPPPLAPGVEEEEGDGKSGHARQPSFTTAMAAPKPRHAVPTDDFEEAAEDAAVLEPSVSAATEEAPEIQGSTAGQEEVQSQAEQVHGEGSELISEEDEEAERKANLTRRMAALSRGQMMPGMPGITAFGAPMPIKKKTAPVQDHTVQDQAVQDQEEPEEASNRVSSPPPPPKSPPPAVPTESANRRGSVQSIASIASPPPLPPGRRSTQISEDDREGGGDSLSRRASFRPPIPKTREPSTASNLDNAVEVEEEEGVAEALTRDGAQTHATAIADQFAQNSPIESETPQSSAPPLVLSPTTANRASVDRSLPSTPQIFQQPSSETSNFENQQTESSRSQKNNSSRDLDLMPSAQWWRKGLNPLRLPPTIAGRPDCILYVDQASQTKRGRTKHTAEIHVLFEDYSQSVVELSFEDDDAQESATVLNQRHYFPPSKPTGEQLSNWAETIGSAIAKAASSTTGKQTTIVGDGSPRSFISTLLTQVKSALPPINQTYGIPILVQVGATIMEKSSDEIKPGDIVACFNADFKGKKGLTPYHLALGSQVEPSLAVVVEVESKKNKLRCILQGGKKGPEEISLRLDDLRSGVLKVFRAVPNQGYLEDW